MHLRIMAIFLVQHTHRKHDQQYQFRLEYWYFFLPVVALGDSKVPASHAPWLAGFAYLLLDHTHPVYFTIHTQYNP